MRKTGKRILIILTILSLVTGLSCFSAETDYILNGDFSQVSKNTPINWALSGGAMLRMPLRQPAAGSQELCANGGFEDLTGGAPTGWRAYWGPWNGTNLFVNSSIVHSGTKSIKVLGVSGDSMVALYDVPDNTVVPGALYQVSCWLYVSSERPGGRGSIGMSLYNGDEILESQRQWADDAETDTWTRVVCTVRIPEECTRVIINCTIQASGCIYFDDVSLYMVEAPVPFTMETEDVFHYSDNETGKVHVNMNAYYSDLSARVDFAVKDGSTVIAEQKNVAFSQNTAGWTYDITSLEMRREYVVTANVRSSVWTGELTQKIYKYPRPTCLTKEGVYMSDGKPFIPVIAYWPGDFARLPEVGINVAEIGASSVQTTLEKLDQLKALGMKALVSLYFGPAYLYPAGHPDNIALTKQIVKAVRNHPAVFAYAVQDEPYGGIMEHMDKWLMESYKIIRDIDEAHPIYIVEFVRSCFDRAGKMADVLAVDPYPFQSNSYTVTDAVKTARGAVNYKKPVYAILQTYDAGRWFPTVDNIREQIYRALEEGATGIGYYSIWQAKGQNTATTDDDKALYETDRWEPMKTYAAVEMKEILAYYALHESKTFSRYYEPGHYGFYYESWVRDGDLYMVVHNRSTGTVSVRFR